MERRKRLAVQVRQLSGRLGALAGEAVASLALFVSWVTT
jgi:hypothetical protein